MVQRREFIKKTLAGTAGVAAGTMGLSARSYASILGSNDRINCAVIGFNGRGLAHIGEILNIRESHNLSLKVLCDVDESLFPAQNKRVREAAGYTPKNEWDMRRVFENKDIDAVFFATPNYWHALGTIWACQAGKHVYVEKPSCHNVFEGRKMVEAARKYDVRVQVGYNNRGNSTVMQAIKFLHDGGIGDVYMARGLCLKPRNSFGIAPDSTPPSSLHYDMWMGPASYQTYNEKKLPYNWHWFWNTGNGDIGNQGSHQLDLARMGLNKGEHPVSVYSTGGLYGWDSEECAQETPDTLSTLFKYDDGKVLEFETRGRPTNHVGSLGVRIGNIFYGTEGYLELNNGGNWAAFKNRDKEPFAGPKNTDPVHGEGHFANFVNAVRSGNEDGLNCNIREGHYSSVLPLLANVSYRLGRELKFMGDFEKFANDDEANTMLTRNYRHPYVVPEEV